MSIIASVFQLIEISIVKGTELNLDQAAQDQSLIIYAIDYETSAPSERALSPVLDTVIEIIGAKT